jgi:mannosyl-oligosaccharide alpha-1,2-mannosidase
MYTTTPSGLAPEITHFNTHDANGADLIVKSNDAHNLLRPETIESLFVMYRVTRDEKWRDAGWKMFEAFEKHCKVDSGGRCLLCCYNVFELNLYSSRFMPLCAR